ncbi:uncharacterized protein LOC127847420 [Dreissena polymorpha]|uniref:Uncharacterized protein n=1 Tax=Dreissena polymorpha TaxID=45954 RepID=A0A9D4N7M7_DREPO|nr:uncharacterized protein LOC127847420 [Dreissena polymorpha]KAH3888744.1 hypothetical protein DPMN_012784 [Dreissena polymorpha]
METTGSSTSNACSDVKDNVFFWVGLSFFVGSLVVWVFICRRRVCACQMSEDRTERIGNEHVSAQESIPRPIPPPRPEHTKGEIPTYLDLEASQEVTTVNLYESVNNPNPASIYESVQMNESSTNAGRHDNPQQHTGGSVKFSNGNKSGVDRYEKLKYDKNDQISSNNSKTVDPVKTTSHGYAELKSATTANYEHEVVEHTKKKNSDVNSAIAEDDPDDDRAVSPQTKYLGNAEDDHDMRMNEMCNSLPGSSANTKPVERKQRK